MWIVLQFNSLLDFTPQIILTFLQHEHSTNDSKHLGRQYELYLVDNWYIGSQRRLPGPIRLCQDFLLEPWLSHVDLYRGVQLELFLLVEALTASAAGAESALYRRAA